MISIAAQDRADLGGRWSVLTRQHSDHIRLQRLLEELPGCTTKAAEDAQLRRIARLVFPHAFAEESVLWPAARRRLPDGDAPP